MKEKYDLKEFVSAITEQEITIKIINNVKERRKELKLTQRELAKRSGVSYASIRRFETIGEISFTSLLKIASALNSLEDFYLLFNNEIVTNLKEYK